MQRYLFGLGKEKRLGHQRTLLWFTMALSINELEARYTNQLEALRAELRTHILQTNNVDKLLADDSFDNKLAQLIVLNDGTPKSLAQFASINDMNEVLIDQLLNDTSLMNEILVADGASGRGHVREKKERGEKKKGKGKEKREERVIPSTRISIPIEL
jgi:hypothetical protein